MCLLATKMAWVIGRSRVPLPPLMIRHFIKAILSELRQEDPGVATLRLSCSRRLAIAVCFIQTPT